MDNPGKFKKGEKKPNQGKRGPNKTTLQLKEMILQALDEAGGVPYLVQQAKNEPKAFLGLIGKVLPLQVQGDLNHTGGIHVTIRRD